MKNSWKDGPGQEIKKYKDCVRYFREYPVFHRLLCGFREKYSSYGKFSGTVTLRNLSAEEKEALGAFSGKNYYGQKTVSISADKFEKALENSRFQGISPKELLEAYFGEALEGKKEKLEKEKQQWEKCRRELLEENKNFPAEKWLEQLKIHSIAEKEMRLGADMLNSFPVWDERTEYLPIYAAAVTGNPHSFDRGTKEARLLDDMVKWYTGDRKTETGQSEIFKTLKKKKDYLNAGILSDDVSNYAMLFGVRAWKKNGKIHKGMEGFLQEEDMVQIPLQVIAGWEKVECPSDRIYIVENPSIYAMLFRKWKGKKACMCMNGQPRMSSLLLLDLLARSQVTVCYAGDFDPEGLLIAQKVKEYYKGTCKYWKMTPKLYEKSRSEEKISPARIKMLDQIEDEDLVPIAQMMRKNPTAGYQERIYEEYG